MERFELEFDDVAALRDAYQQHLRHGRAFVPGRVDGVAALDECTVALVHPDNGQVLELPATVVLLQDDPPATCVELTDAAPLASFVAERPVSPHDRIRKLSLPEQHKLARTGELQDRVALERIFGKHVWEPLLQNPRLTVPEVARIARKGTVPRPLLDQIVDHATWIKAAAVRRALLTNPRVGGEAHAKILRVAPKNELKLIEKQNLYPSAVREIARRLLRR